MLSTALPTYCRQDECFAVHDHGHCILEWQNEFFDGGPESELSALPMSWLIDCATASVIILLKTLQCENLNLRSQELSQFSIDVSN